MTESISEFKDLVEKRFCTRCNREVPRNEISVEQTVVIDSGYIIRIDELFKHDGCGGMIQKLLLNY